MNLITQPRTLIDIFLYVHKKTIAISYYSSKITKKATLRFRRELLKTKIRTKEERTLKETLRVSCICCPKWSWNTKHKRRGGGKACRFFVFVFVFHRLQRSEIWDKLPETTTLQDKWFQEELTPGNCIFALNKHCPVTSRGSGPLSNNADNTQLTILLGNDIFYCTRKVTSLCV